jgi:hypothetical protein
LRARTKESEEFHGIVTADSRASLVQGGSQATRDRARNGDPRAEFLGEKGSLEDLTYPNRDLLEVPPSYDTNRIPSAEFKSLIKVPPFGATPVARFL